MPDNKRVADELSEEFNKAANHETEKTPDAPENPRLVLRPSFRHFDPNFWENLQELLVYVKTYNRQEEVLKNKKPSNKIEDQRSIRGTFTAKANGGFAKTNPEQAEVQTEEDRLREKFNAAASENTLHKNFNNEAQKEFTRTQFNRAADQERGR